MAVKCNVNVIGEGRDRWVVDVLGEGRDRWVVECIGRGRIGGLLNGIREEKDWRVIECNRKGMG